MITYRLHVPFDFAAHFTGVAAHLKLAYQTPITMLDDGVDYHVLMIEVPDESWLDTWGIRQYVVV